MSQNHSFGDFFLSPRIPLQAGEVFYYPDFLSLKRADALYQTFVNQVPWRQDEIKMYGKLLPVPRLSAWYGDPEATYTYSGIEWKPIPFFPELSLLKSDVVSLSKQKFNSVLLNWYRNGDDAMSWHADNERELGPDPIIASLSLGVERDFILKNRVNSKEKYTFPLGHGSLLIMGSGVQSNYIHAVPRRKHLNQGRINLTFREIFP